MIDQDNFYPGLQEHQVSEHVFWQMYKHWGDGHRAAEGLEQVSGDRSGCITYYMPPFHEPMTRPAIVSQARLYYNQSHTIEISAVYSYPGGLSFVPEGYFWEIYMVTGTEIDDIERFSTEKAMEDRVIELIEGAV